MEDSTPYVSNFDNESTAEFFTILKQKGILAIFESIEKVLQPERRLGLIACEEALIAVECLCAANGFSSPDMPDNILHWIQKEISKDEITISRLEAIKEQAADVIDKLTADSELREFWEDHPGFDAWLNKQIDLQNRVLGDR